jgi:hypothetical protein
MSIELQAQVISEATVHMPIKILWNKKHPIILIFNLK